MNRDERIAADRQVLERTDTSELRAAAGRMYGLDGPDTRQWDHGQLVEWHLRQKYGEDTEGA